MQVFCQLIISISLLELFPLLFFLVFNMSTLSKGSLPKQKIKDEDIIKILKYFIVVYKTNTTKICAINARILNATH